MREMVKKEESQMTAGFLTCMIEGMVLLFIRLWPGRKNKLIWEEDSFNWTKNA